MVQQAYVPPWTRAAIHDSVASIIRQTPYHRDVQRTLFDRIVRWIIELIDRIFASVRGVPYGREVAIGAALLLAILVIGRIVYAGRLRAQADEELARSEIDTRTATDPWRDTERLAAAGQYTEAAHALYRAVIVALASRKLVRAHSSKTSGDYARELRRRAGAAETPFRRFGARYHRIIYGTGMCDGGNYHALRDEAASVLAATRSERAA